MLPANKLLPRIPNKVFLGGSFPTGHLEVSIVVRLPLFLSIKMASMEEESGTLSPISSTASTAVEHQTNGLLFPSPQKSHIIQDVSSPSSSLTVPRRNPSLPRERRSFSSAQKLPVLEPSTFPIRRRFDLLLLWILQTSRLCSLILGKLKHRVIDFIWGILYVWYEWLWWCKYMI